MSAIGGVFSRNGRSWSPDLLEGLALDLRIVGPDGAYARSLGPAGMVFCPFWTDEGRVQDRQPFAADDDHLLAWNGRLDNRPEVEAALADETARGELARLGEGALVLRVLRRWGTVGLRRLVGDFSLALFDRRAARLVLATDALGIRQLYFHVNDDFVFWASRARAVLALAGLPADPDPEYVAGFLLRHRHFDRSPYRRVARLEASHALTADPQRTSLERYWTPDPDHRIRYRTDAEYEEHFRHVLRQAVAARLRASGPVFADLSGGLDSSSVVCVADEILAAGESPIQGLHTTSHVYDRNPLSDEREFIQVVEEQRGRQGFYVTEVDAPLLQRSPRHDFRPDQPNGQLVYLARHRLLAAHMKRKGARVLLRGFGGDEIGFRSPGPGPGPIGLADHLARGRFLAAVRSARQWSRVAGSSLWRSSWWGGMWPLLPKDFAARVGPYRKAEFFERTRDFVGPALREIGHLDRRVLGHGYDGGLPLPSQRYQCSILFEMAHFVVPDLILDEGCCEIRYPFYDRRLLEFVLAVPVEQQIRPGQSRSLMRRALRGTLPPRILHRRSKGGPEQAFFRALRESWDWIGKWPGEARVVERGWIARETLNESIKQARHGVGTGPLLRIFALEFWLETVETPMPSQGGLSPTPLPKWHNQGGNHEEDLRDPRSVRAG